MGRDKALLPFEGATLVERVVDAVRVRCDPAFVVAAPGQPLPELPAAILRDEVRGLGPLSATGQGLRAAAKAGADWAFVCAVDMPFISAELIDHLINSSAHQGIDVVLPWDGRDHYLAGLYRTALADRIDDLAGDGARSMRALLGSVPAQRIVMSASQSLTNVNTAPDLHWTR